MDETEIAVKLEALSHETGSLKHRVANLEKDNVTTQTLVISVNKLAVNMEHMLEEQKEQGSRLNTLERVPHDTYKQIKTAVITALVGGVVGAVITAVITLL